MSENKEPQQEKNVSKFSGGSLRPLLWIVLLSIILLKFPESGVVLLIGLLPTMVAFVVDKSSGKYATFCVGSLNITGISPSIFELWAGDNSMSQAIQIITNVFDLVIMYGAAGFGWILYIIIPSAVSALLTIIGQRRIARFRGRQRELISKWGKDVAARPEQENLSEKINSPVDPPTSANSKTALNNA